MRGVYNKRENERVTTHSPFFQKESVQPFFAPGSAPVQAKMNVGHAGDPQEKEADSAADHVVEQLSTPSIQTPALRDLDKKSIQKKCDTCKNEEEEEGMVQKQDMDSAGPTLQEPAAEPSAEADVEDSTKSGTGMTAPGSTAKALTPSPPSTTAPLAGKYIVEDAETPGLGQMKKTPFLSRLKGEICLSINESLAGSSIVNPDCSFVDAAFSKHAKSSPLQLEEMLLRYAPEIDQANDVETVILRMKSRVAQKAKQFTQGGPNIFKTLEMFGSSMFFKPPGDTPGNKENSNILFKGEPGASSPATSPASVLNGLGKGQPISSPTRGKMESAFNDSFSDVEVHTDSKAAKLSKDMNARAFTVGNHIAFGQDELKPSSVQGDLLMAHELAHVLQQRNTKSLTAEKLTDSTHYNDLENEADDVALNVVAVSNPRASKLIGPFQRKRSTGLKSGLKIQRCNGHSTAEKNAAVAKMAAIIGQPDMYEADIIAIIDDMGKDAAEVLMHTGPFTSKASSSQLHQLAGTEAGMRVMERASKALRDGDIVARTRAKEIDKILADRKTGTPPTVSPGDQVDIARINKALSTDPHMSEYQKGKWPLLFPVKKYQSRMESFGGVYYDPTITISSRVAGITESSSWTSPKHPTQYPLVFIRLGPLALSFSDEYIRSVMWHEFQHYKQNLSFREPEANKSADTKLLEAENQNATTDKPNMEMEATSTELADYFTLYSNDEAKASLRYLADHMGHSKVNAAFKTKGVDRVKNAVAGDRAKQDRMLKLIKMLSRTEQNNLKDLSDAIKNNLTPLPPKPKKKKAK